LQLVFYSALTTIANHSFKPVRYDCKALESSSPEAYHYNFESSALQHKSEPKWQASWI